MLISRRNLLAASPLMFLPTQLAHGNEHVDGSEFPEFTERSERSIERGTKWLLKTMNRDGGCGVDIGTPTDVSCTAAVGLAFLAQGNSPIAGPLQGYLVRLRDYLLEVTIDKRIRIDLNTQVKADLSGYADHHFAALMLSQTLGQDREFKAIKNALTSLIETISRGQTNQGHWGEGRYPRLAAVTGWSSLRASFFAGMKVQADATRTARYLIAQMRAGGGHGNFFATASGIRVLYAMEMDNNEVGKKAFEEAQRAASKYFPTFNQLGGEQYLAFHFINETMLQRGGYTWKEWFPLVRDKMIDAQNADGSWVGHSCIVSRTFCTACALLVLTSPNRYLPISQA